MNKGLMIDELAVCKSLIEGAEMALGNKQYFDDAVPVIDILDVIQEKLEKCIEALREEFEEQKK